MPVYGEQGAFFDDTPYRETPVQTEAEVTHAEELAAETAAMDRYDRGRSFGQDVLQLI